MDSCIIEERTKNRLMSKLTNKQKEVLTLMRVGYELCTNTMAPSLSPILIKQATPKQEPTSMHTITSLLFKKLIKYGQKYNPPYQFYILTDDGKTIKL